MDPTWTTTILLVPCTVVLTAGCFYLYSFVLSLLTKMSVRNKVVVITDAVSGLGKGNTQIHCPRCESNTLFEFKIMYLCHVISLSFFFFVECASVFHKGGSRLILCGKNWEKLTELADDLENASNPTTVSISEIQKINCSECFIAHFLKATVSPL